jgi:hypothetical protein
MVGGPCASRWLTRDPSPADARGRHRGNLSLEPLFLSPSIASWVMIWGYPKLLYSMYVGAEPYPSDKSTNVAVRSHAAQQFSLPCNCVKSRNWRHVSVIPSYIILPSAAQACIAVYASDGAIILLLLVCSGMCIRHKVVLLNWPPREIDCMRLEYPNIQGRCGVAPKVW